MTWASMRASLGTKTGRNTGISFGSQVAAAALGFAANVILIRVLPVADYGLFSLFLSALMLFAGFFHLGGIETFVRFGAKHRDDALYPEIRNALLLRTLASAAVLAFIAWLCAPWISRTIYLRDDFAVFLKVAAAGAVAMTLYSFVQSELRVRDRFRAFFFTHAGSAGLRLAIIAFLAASGGLSLAYAVGLQILIPCLFIGICIALRGAIPRPSGLLSASPVRGEISHYNAWLLVSMFATNLIGNIDAHFLAHYHTNETLSAFGVASRLTLPIFFAANALTTAILPRLSAVRDISEIRLFVDRIIPFLVAASAGILLLAWLAPPLLIWIAGEKYAGIDTLLRLQILTALVMLVAGPFGIILSALGRVRFLAALNVVQLAIDLVLNFLWIPSLGAMGAILATLVINFVGLIVIGIAVTRVFKSRRLA